MSARFLTGSKAEPDQSAHPRLVEGRHVDLAPEGEHEEVARSPGFRGRCRILAGAEHLLSDAAKAVPVERNAWAGERVAEKRPWRSFSWP